MSFQHVPTEILEQIFNYLLPQKHAIFICSAVCKSWRAPASRLYFETITIDDDRLWHRLANQARGNNFGIWVRKIIIEDDLQDLSQKQRFQLMLYLPYLKVIDLEESERRDHHLALLSKMNSLKYLERITPGARGWTQSEFKVYLGCAYNYRHSLKYLDLSLPNIFCSKNGQYGSLVSYLQNFVNLSHLSIKNISSQGGGDPNLKMFDIIQSYPNLVSFSLCNVYQELADSNQLDTKTTQPQLKLKEFDVHVPNFTKSHIDYVTSYFPAHLDKFKLSITKTTEHVKWLQRIGESSITQFGKYLGFVKEVELVISDYVTCAEPLSTITSHKVITSYWSLINGIIGKREQLNFHISVTVDDMKKTNKLNDHLRIKRNQKNMYVSYPLDLEEVLARFSSEIPNAIQSVIPLSSSSRHHQLKESKINSIEVNVNQYNLSTYRCLDLLRSALNTYTRLNLIKFSCNAQTGKVYHMKFGSNPEDCNTKTYPQSHQSFDKYPQVSRPTTTPSVDNLKYIYLRSAPLVTSSLKTISELLPNTKVLKLVDCDIEKDAESQNVTIDIGRMRHLNKLVIDIGFLFGNNYQHIVIQVEQSTRTTCYEWKKTSNKKSCSADFVPTDAKFLSNYSHCTSASVISVTIKCQKIDEINICLEKDTIAATLHPNLV